MQRLAITVLAICFACPTQGQEWGDLSVRFVYDGEPPKPREILVDKDIAACGKKLPDESLLVNAKGRGIANVVMWLQPGSDESQPLVHPDLQRSTKEVTLVVKNCRFEPHIQLARSTQTLVAINEDPIGHAFRVDLSANLPLGVLLAGRREIIAVLKKEESGAVRIMCNIHPWMHGFLFVRDSPYIAVSDASGKLTMPKLPAGKWTFRVWHERKGYIRQITQDGHTIELPRQGWSLEIKAGENDLGDVLLKPAQFERN